MGKIKDILVEVRDTAYEMKNNPENNCLERVQFACQIWNLNQMIRAVGSIEHMAHNIRNKCR